jgi:hypothetical protein
MTNVLHTDRIERGIVLGNIVLVTEVFAKNGFLVLSSVTGVEQAAEVNADKIDLPFSSPNLHTSASDPDKYRTRDGTDDAPGGSYDQPDCGLRELC